MTEYTAGSAHAGSASVARAHIIGSWVHVTTKERHGSASTALAPDVARAFARGILALADEIDGGEAKEASAPAPIKAGDTIRVLRHEADGASVRAGDVYTVREVGHSGRTVRVDGGGLNGFWHLSREHVELVDEPAGLLKGSALEPAPSPFARYVEEAKRLLTGIDHTGADVIVLAKELHRLFA